MIALLYLLIAVFYYLFNTPYYQSKIQNQFPQKYKEIISALLFALLVIIFVVLLHSSNEGFLFQVTPGRPICNKALSGRPIGFEFTPDQDRWRDQKVNIARYGWDGFLAPNIYSKCKVNGCYCQKPCQF